MRRALPALLAAAAPAPAFAHDAFGDLGPFYASLLHPLADPLQAALLVGGAAFLAGRPLSAVRLALPVFVGAAALAHVVLGWRLGLAPSALSLAAVAVATGGAAALPGRRDVPWAGFLLLAAAGALAGLSPDRPAGANALQSVLGTVLGMAIFTTLAWSSFDSLSRAVSPLAPAVAGSWVAAVGLLAGAFAFVPPEGVPDDPALTAIPASPVQEGREP